MRTLIYVRLVTSAEVGKADLTGASYSSQKDCYFAAFSVASGVISPKTLQDHTYPIPIHLPSYVQIPPVVEVILYPKMFSRLITVSA